MTREIPKPIFVCLMLLVMASCSAGYRSITKTTSETVGKYEKPCPTNPVYTDPRDSIEYNVIQIGEQCWMKENLKWLPAVSQPSDYSMTDPYYYVYDYQGNDVQEAKQTSNYNNYGVLYNWMAATEACPPGWRLPDWDDWNELKQYMINKYEEINPDNINRKIKSEVLSVTPRQARKKGADNFGWKKSRRYFGTNEFGFSALPGGTYNNEYEFRWINYWAFFWGYHECSQVTALIQSGGSHFGNFSYSDLSKENGLSIRCIQGDHDDQKEITTVITDEEYRDFISHIQKTIDLTNRYYNGIKILGVASLLVSTGIVLTGFPVNGVVFLIGMVPIVMGHVFRVVYSTRGINHEKDYRWNCDFEDIDEKK